MFHRTNVLCCKKRSPQKKKYSNSKVREENIAVVFIQLWSLQLEKFLLFSSRWWRGVCESWLFDTRLSQQIGVWRVGATGTFNAPVLKTVFNYPKILLLVFLYRDFGEWIEDPRIFDVACETRDNTSVIILKSRQTLQVILPARAILVTPSLIDDSARP